MQMAMGGDDSSCLPLKIIMINILKRLPMKSLVDSFFPSGKQTAIDGGNSPYLPSEIITNILKRLPVKSLLRLRSVCKGWRNLLKSESFIAEHYRHSKKNPLLISYLSIFPNSAYTPLCLFRHNLDMGALEGEGIPKMDSLRRITGIIGSSNGLLCVKLGYDDRDPPPSLLLLNPATREVKQVPRSKNYNGNYSGYGQAFGYCPVVRDYKIVMIYGGEAKRVEVFSLTTGSWKEVEFGIKVRIVPCSKPVAVNGTIFWPGWLDRDRGFLISFDLGTEAFTLIPMPSPASVEPRHTYAHVLGVYDENKVGMIQRFDDYKFHLWVLEEGSRGDGAKGWGWTNLYSIGPTPHYLIPMCIWKNEIVTYHLVPDFLFNLTTNNEVKKVHCPVFTVPSMLATMPHVESLVSMCHDHDTYLC